jgi:hypothetical protein
MTDRAALREETAARMRKVHTRCLYCRGRVFGRSEFCWRAAIANGHAPWLGSTRYDGWMTPRRRLALWLDTPMRRIGL